MDKKVLGLIVVIICFIIPIFLTVLKARDKPCEEASIPLVEV